MYVHPHIQTEGAGRWLRFRAARPVRGGRGQNYNYHLPNCPQERGRRVVGEGTRKGPSILVEAFQNEESLTKVNNQQSTFGNSEGIQKENYRLSIVQKNGG